MAGVGAAHRIYETFGEQVRERRDSLRMTQLQLSALIGLTRGSVANIEAGRQSVLLHQFLAIAAALQLTPEQLLPAHTEALPAGEMTDMPESVLNALKSIRKSAGARAPARR
nr:helix-turn-helix transcriptional regulator [uncultured Rhodopila sp.]